MATAIITGSNSGLGLHLVKSLYSTGIYSTIVMACRNVEKAKQAITEIEQTSDVLQAKLQFIQLDLTSKSSINNFVDEFSHLCQDQCLHLLVNNAGIMNHPYKLVNATEIHFSSNHLGHFYLTNLLIDKGKFNQNSRILIISSGYYEKCKTLLSVEQLKSPEPLMSPTEYYAHSKLANCLHAIELSKKLATKIGCENMKVIAIRPGFIRGTQLGRYTNAFLRVLASPIIWLVAKDLDQGISTMIHCIRTEDSALINGSLYYEKELIKYNEIANDENARRLWNISEEMLNELC